MAGSNDAARALTALGFHVFPLLPGKKTPGLGMHFKDEATRDFGGTPWFVSGENIGIYTGKFGDGEALLVVDVDNKGGRNGDADILALELEGFEFPPTREAATPTGGRHLFFRVAAPVRQSAKRLAGGLDVRSRGGYVVGAGSVASGGSYTWRNDLPVAPAPDWLVARCGDPVRAVDRPGVAAPIQVDAAAARNRVLAYLTGECPPGSEGSRNDTGYRVAARCKDLGVDKFVCVELMAAHWTCIPPLDSSELAHIVDSAYRYGESAPGSAAPEADFKPIVIDEAAPIDKAAYDSLAAVHPFEKLNQSYAFVIAGGGSHILWETKDHRGTYKLEHLASGTFHAKHAAEEIQVGKKSAPVTEEWMRWKGRRSYDGLVFMPGQDAPERFYNLWRGFAVEPAARGGEEDKAWAPVAAWLDHLKENVCRGDAALAKWLIGFFAHMVQRPHEKPLVALVLRGGKGVGKNAFVTAVGNLLGGHSLLTSNRRYLVGNFNGHLENLLLFTLDEAFWSGDKQAEGQLKDLITGNHHVVEHKGKEPYTVANVTRVVILGNEDWLVPASHDERRFAVFDVGDGRKQDREFFADMRRGLEAGGASVLLRFLLDYDIANLDYSGAPSTSGLMDQKHASLEAFPGWWLTCLTEGKLAGGDFDIAWPLEADCDRLRVAFRRHAKERGVRGWIPDDRSMGRSLAKFAPSVKRARLHRGYVYRMPSLDQARAEWSAFIGHEMTWE